MKRNGGISLERISSQDMYKEAEQSPFRGRGNVLNINSILNSTNLNIHFLHSNQFRVD